jgi:hypothetical protein
MRTFEPNGEITICARCKNCAAPNYKLTGCQPCKCPYNPFAEEDNWKAVIIRPARKYVIAVKKTVTLEKIVDVEEAEYVKQLQNFGGTEYALKHLKLSEFQPTREDTAKIEYKLEHVRPEKDKKQK